MGVGRRGTAVVAAAVLVQGLIALPATGQDAASARVSVLAEGLDSPRGVAVDADGAVYVAESGTGGDEHCFTEPQEDEEGNIVDAEFCFGATANITRVEPDGTPDREFVAGLPSVSHDGDAVGASAVSIAPDGEIYVTIGLGESVETREEVAEEWAPAEKFGTLLRVLEDGSTEVVADIAQWEADNNPDSASDLEEGSDSNPNGVHATETTVYVADAGGNSILAVDRASGEIELAALLEPRIVELPPEFGGPADIPMQGVPTSVTESPDGEIVFTQLTGFPFPVGGASVYAVTDDPRAPEVLESGFTGVMAATYRQGELFALEFAHRGLLAASDPDGDLSGALVRVRENGTRTSLLRDTLQVPGGVASDADGTIYLSNGSVFPGGGSLLRFDASQAADPAVASACPPDEVPGADLSDVFGNIHEESIACMGWFGVFTGFADGTFGPHEPISRGQFAATVARLIRSTGTQLPDAEPSFDDAAGTTHGADIGALADVGIVTGFGDGTYRPREAIDRAQAVSIMVQAYAFVTGELPPAGGEDPFGDDDSSVHEDGINRASAAGWVTGVAPDRFAPSDEISRGQSASVLARITNTLVVDGHTSLPS